MKPDLNQFKAFIFDLDGTLIDSEKYHADGFAQAVKTVCGYQITDQERCEFFEAHTRAFAPVLAARHGLDLNPDELLQSKRKYVQKYFKTEVYPHAIHFIKKWRGRTRMALASNSSKAFVKTALIDGRMIDLFEVVCTADDVTQRKPDPEIYTLVIERLGLAPEEALVFEDSSVGVKAAQAVGCPVLMIDNGGSCSADGVKKYTWKELF